MCILFVHTDPNPAPGGYRLVVASNRDEYYARPAKSAFLCPETGLVGGRDMTVGREGGMWLGAAVKPPKICFAALLNANGKEFKSSGVTPRGPIVYNYLTTSQSTPDYIDSLKPPKNYNAFNLVMVELSREEVVVYHHSNSPEDTFTYRGHQNLGFGNTTPSTPFAKVRYGQKKFRKIVENAGGNKEELVEELLDLLKCKERNLPDPELKRCVPNGHEQMSSIFVETVEGTYGTRTHSLILVDYDYNVEFIEHTMREPVDANDVQWAKTVINLRL